MATRAEKFRSEQARAGAPKPKRPRRPRRDTIVDTSKPGVSATDRKVGAGSTATRNRSKRAAKKGGAALEDSATGRPSRKSSRRSTGRAKRESNLARRTKRATTSATARARREK